MAKKSKRYNETLAKVDRDAFYHPLDAVKLAQDLLQELRRHHRRRNASVRRPSQG